MAAAWGRVLVLAVHVMRAWALLGGGPRALPFGLNVCAVVIQSQGPQTSSEGGNGMLPL